MFVAMVHYDNQDAEGRAEGNGAQRNESRSVHLLNAVVTLRRAADVERR
jgi:hypothetical protein